MSLKTQTAMSTQLAASILIGEHTIATQMNVVLVWKSTTRAVLVAWTAVVQMLTSPPLRIVTAIRRRAVLDLLQLDAVFPSHPGTRLRVLTPTMSLVRISTCPKIVIVVHLRSPLRQQYQRSAVTGNSTRLTIASRVH